MRKQILFLLVMLTRGLSPCAFKKTIPEENGKFAPYKKYLYMHEFGHYLQSQEYGWGYLFSVGIPSLWSAIKDNGEYVSYNGAANVPKHNTHWFEIHANVKAYDYFKKKGKIDTWEEEKKYPLY